MKKSWFVMWPGVVTLIGLLWFNIGHNVEASITMPNTTPVLKCIDLGGQAWIVNNYIVGGGDVLDTDKGMLFSVTRCYEWRIELEKKVNR